MSNVFSISATLYKVVLKSQVIRFMALTSVIVLEFCSGGAVLRGSPTQTGRNLFPDCVSCRDQVFQKHRSTPEFMMLLFFSSASRTSLPYQPHLPAEASSLLAFHCCLQASSNRPSSPNVLLDAISVSIRVPQS